MPRHKAFDPGYVLDKALHVFWYKGFQATSVQDLVEAMGINRFSLYDTFGDKHQLFMAALKRYETTYMSEQLNAMENSQEGLAAIRRYFHSWIEWSMREGGCPGCLVMNSAVELGPHDGEAAVAVRKSMQRLENAFFVALRRARNKGEVSVSLNLRDHACLLANNASGMGVLSKAGLERKTLENIVITILAILKNA